MNERVKLTSKKPCAKSNNSISHKQKNVLPQFNGSPVSKILFLQRTIGNQAVEKLINSGSKGIQREQSRIPFAGFIGEIDDTPAIVPGLTDERTPTRTSGSTGGGGCTDICNRAYANSSLNSGGGGVICDGATKCACVFDVAPLRKGQCPGFDAIVLNHERQHLTDVDCNPSGGLHRPPFRDPSAANASECTHRRASIAEMDRIIPGAAGICKTGMQSIRSQLNTWVTANCGASTP